LVKKIQKKDKCLNEIEKKIPSAQNPQKTDKCLKNVRMDTKKKKPRVRTEKMALGIFSV